MEKALDLKHRFFTLKTLLSFTAGFAVLYLVIGKADAARALASMQSVSIPVYLMGFILYYLTFPLRSMRFRHMLGRNGCSAGLVQLTQIILLSWFANCIVPAKLGDLWRAYLVKKNFGTGFTTTVGTVFAERVYDLFVLYLLIGASGIIAFRGRIPGTMMTVLESGFVLIALLMILLLFMKHLGPRVADRLPEKIRSPYKCFLSGAMSSMGGNGKIFLLTMGVWLLEGASFYLVTTALGLTLTFVQVIFIGLISALLTALPVTPAGLGIVEAAKVGILLLFQVDRGTAVSAALLDRFINYWSLLLVGFVVLTFSDLGKMAKGAGAFESDDSYPHIQ